ncbi:hypothetical protein COUCH_23705 [Couchioplanes caeruleus]|nr:hypothetical protein [Couchioplanes caeruleus]UQU62042.1 hypothetical protein COUCH_23705 [Couchioplanes caeruleus]
MNSLMGWLRRDGQVARSAEIIAVPAANGSMGALEVIDVVVSNATGIAGLLVAYRAWRQAKRQTAPVTIVINNVSVVHDGTDEADRRVVRAVEAAAGRVSGDPGDGAA